MRLPQAAVSQPLANKQALAELFPASEPALVPLAPKTAQEATAPTMPMIAIPINVKPAKLNQATVKPLMVSPVQRKPTVPARLAAPVPPKTMKTPVLRPITVPSPPQTWAPQKTALQDLHIRQANLLKGQRTLDMIAKKGGLDMEIFWPDTERQSAYLYDVMTRCFGMRSAVLDHEGEASGASSATHALLLVHDLARAGAAHLGRDRDLEGELSPETGAHDKGLHRPCGAD